VWVGTAVDLKEARRRLEQIEPLRSRGAISERSHHDAELAVRRGEADERAALAKLEQQLKRPLQREAAELEAKIAAAQSGVEAARAELEHYTVRAAIAGVISRLDVHPGTVSRPGISVWGEILDLSELDVLCEITPSRASRLTAGRPAEVREEGALDGPWAARVVSIGIAADPHSGRVPVRLRLGNSQRRLRCYVPVTVQFHAEPTLAGPC
jgi:multidrug resistance efflux pump